MRMHSHNAEQDCANAEMITTTNLVFVVSSETQPFSHYHQPFLLTGLVSTPEYYKFLNLLAGETGEVNTPCREGGFCIDGNAECVRGLCRCMADFYFDGTICGKIQERGIG